MTIKEMADAYIGYPPEMDESYATTGARKAYEQGAKDMIDKAYDWWSKVYLMGEPDCYHQFKKAMEE